jgi:nucleosome binding factor SPN SPT16 subunit
MQRKVGILNENSKQTGAFVEEWDLVWAPYKKDVEEVDISSALSTAAFAVKDEKELASLNFSQT